MLRLQQATAIHLADRRKNCCVGDYYHLSCLWKEIADWEEQSRLA